MGVPAILIFVVWIWIELAFEIFASVFFEVILAVTHALDEDKGARIPAAVLLGVTGVFYGALVLAPIRLPLKFYPLASLIALPIVVGLAMVSWGRLRTSRRKNVSHLGTWYGGGALGLGLAIGRLVPLAFAADV